MNKFWAIFTLLFLIFANPIHVSATWINDDNSIQKVNQDKVPQLNIYGSIQESYDQNSFFPLILYFTDMGPVGQPWTKFNLDSTKSRDTMPEVQTAGFNTSWPSWFTPTNQELDHAKTYGIKIIANLSNEITTLFTNYTPENIQAFKSTIARLRDHSSVIGYHLYDEFPPYSSAQYQEIKTLIRSVDPNKIVFANHYEKGCDDTFEDISNFDVYPFKSTGVTASLLQTASAINSTLSSGCPRPAWVIIQSFRDDKHSWRIPTPIEMRGQIYTAIVHGATGIYSFMQHTPWAWNTKNGGEGYLEDKESMAGISPQVNSNLWQEISKINHEITKYQKIFLSKTSTDVYHIFKGTTNSVHTILKDNGEKNVRYLLAVNMYSSQTTEKFVFSSTLSSVYSLLDNNPITPTGSEFVDGFTPFGVHLYQLSFGSSPTPSLPPTGFRLADLNQDTKVDIFDYNIFVSEFKKSGSYASDVDRDGQVTIIDYNLIIMDWVDSRR